MSGNDAAAPLILEAARYENFKCLADVTVPIPSRFTLLVGRNASGKSSVLDGIDIATQMLVPREGETLQPPGRAGAVFAGNRGWERLRTGGRSGALKLQLSFVPRLAFVVEAGPRGFSVNVDEPGRPERGFGWHRAGDGTWRVVGDASRFDSWVRIGRLPAATRLRLSSSTAASASPAVRRGVPRVDHDGYGLPTVLAWLAGNQPRVKAEIEAALAKVVPGAGTITTPSAEVRRLDNVPVRIGEDAFLHTRHETVAGHTFCLDIAGAEAVPADLLSDGTVLTLALLTVLYGPECPRLVLIDDIDAELHPAAQLELVVALRRILELKPDVQIIATTHSPYLLDSFEPGHVVVLNADPKTGHTSARLLSEHPRAASSKGMLRTGELWSAVGEDWASGDASAATK